MRYTARLVFVSLLVVSLLVVGATVAGVAGPAGSVAGGPLGQLDIEADDVLMEVSVESSGDAAWTIEYRTRLDGGEDEQAFEELRSDVEADPDAYTDRFRDRMESTVSASAEATDREMSVADVRVSVERRDLPREYGVLTYEFRWTGFAVVDGDRVTAGDALDGLFLDDETALVVSWPESYGLVEAAPSPTETRDRSVIWVGPVEFTDEEPYVTLDADAPGADGDGGDGVGGFTANPWSTLLGLGVLLAATVIAVVAYRRRRAVLDGNGSAATGGVNTPDSNGSDPSGSSESAPADPSETESGRDAETVSNPDDESDPDASEADGKSAGIDTELLSNEEQVLRLIEANDGRMKQAQVAEELGWTAAKTSQVVTGLRDDGDLDGFRLGRENVLSLPDEER